jgi:predicted MFS family arabinose efflux permease
LLGVVSLAALYFMLPHEPLHAPKGRTLANFRLVLVSIPALAGLSIALLASLGNELVSLIFGVWLEDTFGLQIVALGAAAAVIGFSELSGEGLVAAFSDRLGKPRAVALGLAANCLGALLLPVLGRSSTGALVGLFIFYITFEFTVVSLIPLMTEILPAARATLLAFNVAAFTLGRAVGAPLSVLLYTQGFWVVVVGTVVFNLAALGALGILVRQEPVGSSRPASDP